MTSLMVWAQHWQGLSRSSLTRGIAAAGTLTVMIATANPANADAVDSSVFTRPIPFELVKGHGVAVCEAYLRVLNKARYEAPPFCGRPDPDSEPGFERLEPRYLTASEIYPLFNHVHAFMYFGDQDHVEHIYHANIDSHLGYWDTTVDTEKEIADELKLNYLRVWTYRSPVDIDNDGHADRVLFWQGYGVADAFGSCGVSVSPGRRWGDGDIPQRAFILSDEPLAIDEKRTRAIFGDSSGSSRNAIQSAVIAKRNPFSPLAGSIGIFKYGGLFYMDIEDVPALEKAPEHLNVLLRDHARTTKVCELQTVNKVLSK